MEARNRRGYILLVLVRTRIVWMWIVADGIGLSFGQPYRDESFTRPGKYLSLLIKPFT